ncbi:class I SAM-dependent methyltransferase [uncultured Cohaesibacter sp.]|uniref:class I SAM-dependent methyltransferase n=1 Tax=uncultured Cohaesibacter sp. TaxID=1002546 RepID=UPI00292F2CBC|nr:class I SAM-dependent methyltransferase [uncultured Cohaesibacter sp.]
MIETKAPVAPERLAEAQSLLRRWDAQQTGFIRHRDLRFDSMVTVIRNICQNKKTRVLDLACGPGSLIELLLKSIPEIEIVGVDKDPLLIAIAHDVFGDDDRITLLEVDLDAPSWMDEISGEFDAVVSTTALHWLEPHILCRVYFEIADLIRPGGVFMNGDHLKYDGLSQSIFSEIAKQDDLDAQSASFDHGVDDWDQWWNVAEAVPAYSNAVAKRKEIWANKNNSTPKVTLGYHLETLRSAGFSQTGTVWQYLDDYVLAAFR